MKKLLPALLIALGVVEILIGLMDIKMPIIIAMILGALFIGFGIKILLEVYNAKIKISTGRLLSILGILILCAGLLCNAFEWISHTAFRAIVVTGIITQVAAFIFIIKSNEF